MVHQGYGHPSPTADVAVRTRMKGIARDKADESVTRKAPAWGRDVRRMVADLGDDARGARERALLTIGFAGGFRRSELVGLDVTDVTETNDGLVVRIRRSKTDQEGTGRTIGIPYGSHPSSCPVRAFRAWRQINDGLSGALFRRIHGQATLGKRLTDRSVALIVKASAEHIGLDPADFGGHSLRAGLVTSAADGGASEAAIMEQTGHRSTKQLRDCHLVADPRSSRSMSRTRIPSIAAAVARFTAVVVFVVPPLELRTAVILLAVKWGLPSALRWGAPQRF